MRYFRGIVTRDTAISVAICVVAETAEEAEQKIFDMASDTDVVPFQTYEEDDWAGKPYAGDEDNVVEEIPESEYEEWSNPCEWGDESRIYTAIILKDNGTWEQPNFRARGARSEADIKDAAVRYYHGFEIHAFDLDRDCVDRGDIPTIEILCG